MIDVQDARARGEMAAGVIMLRNFSAKTKNLNKCVTHI